MLEKYVEERFPRYFHFGDHADGRIDVTSTHHDTIATVTRAQAEVLIKDRDKVIDMLVKLAQRFDEVDHEAFSEFWYGG